MPTSSESLSDDNAAKKAVAVPMCFVLERFDGRFRGKLERRPFYPARRPMQYEYRCYNFSLSYSVGLLLGLFLSFDLIAKGNPDGSDKTLMTALF